jgi:putative ABC transport system permease protein
MKTILIAFRSLTRRGRNSLIKILSLSLGLAMALVLVAKVYFEQSYNDFFSMKERIYRVDSNYTSGDSPHDFPQTSGGVVVGMKDVMPEVEAATRYTYINRDARFFTEDRSRYTANWVILADTSLFDVFRLPILSGDAADVLSRPMYVMVSEEIAQMMGGVESAVGQSFQLEDRPGKALTIGGVFRTLPKNTHLSFDVVVSLASIGQFMYDGSLNWLGNDRYISYLRLAPGATAESVRPGIDRVRDKYLDKAILQQAGVDIDYMLIPLMEIHTSDEGVKQTMWLLGILAFALLFTAVMNYLLIVISSLVNRTREMAVHKCYGAGGRNIYGRMLSEALADLLASILVSAVLIYAFRGTILSILGTEAGVLFTPASCLLLAGVCIVVFLISGIVPGYLYAHIPVVAAFQRFSENKRYWKLSLLFVQFIAACFFITLLVIVGRQYNYMLNDNPGYAYDNLAYFNTDGVNGEMRAKILDEVSCLPEVSMATSADELLFNHPSGNNINLPGEDHEMFNIADLYSVADGYFDVMEIPVIEGRAFTVGMEKSREMMVSRSFVERMKDFADWSDGAVGKSLIVSEHSNGKDDPFTICGVYEDVRLGVIGGQDERPSVMFYNKSTAGNLLIRFHRQTPEALARVSELISSLLPDKTVTVNSYQGEIANRYAESRKFRDSVMVSGLATLLISLIGLLGYTNDEMNRRRRETAIRRINGATIPEIIRLFLTDIARVAVLALILGCGIAWYVSEGWMEKFAEKAGLSLTLFLASGVSVLIIILFTVTLNCYRAASENPAVSIKSE